MSTVIMVIICGVVGALIGYLLTKTRAIEEKAHYQYIQAKLSNIESNLSLVQYLLKNIGK